MSKILMIKMMKNLIKTVAVISGALYLYSTGGGFISLFKNSLREEIMLKETAQEL